MKKFWRNPASKIIENHDCFIKNWNQKNRVICDTFALPNNVPKVTLATDPSCPRKSSPRSSKTQGSGTYGVGVSGRPNFEMTFLVFLNIFCTISINQLKKNSAGTCTSIEMQEGGWSGDPTSPEHLKPHCRSTLVLVSGRQLSEVRLTWRLTAHSIHSFIHMALAKIAFLLS